MEAKYPGKYIFQLNRDPGVTGRLEVTIYFNSQTATEVGGVLVHSKKNGQGYINSNWAAFDQRWDDAVKANTK
jgi:hypothetical protein